MDIDSTNGRSIDDLYTNRILNYDDATAFSASFTAAAISKQLPQFGAIENNGRVPLLNSSEDPLQSHFQFAEKIAIRNKATEYRDPIAGVWENNALAQVYFSTGNIQILQNGIRAGVFKLSNGKYVVPPQNLDALKIVMRSTYLQYAKHSATDITAQVEVLNQLVWDYCIPFVYKESISYNKYLIDQSTLVVPLERETRPDRDYKQLVMKPWF
jgi:hypothetical protein